MISTENFCKRLKIIDPNIKKFIEITLEDLKKHKIKLRIESKPVYGTYKLDGYFDDVEKKIAFRKQKDWLETYVHEYCHFLQWKTKHPSFLAYYKHGFNAIEIVENWLDYEIEYSPKVSKSFDIIRSNEYHCERLAVKTILEHSLPIDLEAYVRRSNRYFLFYHCVQKTRNWTPKTDFYNEKFLKSLPKTLSKRYVRKISEKMSDKLLPYFS